MSASQQLIAGIAGFALIGVYSWIMMASAGSAASWAWIVLAAAVVLLGSTARSVAAAREDGRGR